MARYTLWRGGQLLGSFHERGPVKHHDSPVGAFGILEPIAGAKIPSIMQTRFDVLSGRPYFQHPLETDWLGAPTTRARNPGPVALEPLSPEDARGVAPDAVLEIRDHTGRAVDATMISIQHLRIAPGVDIPAHSEAADLFRLGPDAWLISFSSVPPNEELKPTAAPSSLIE